MNCLHLFYLPAKRRRAKIKSGEGHSLKGIGFNGRKKTKYYGTRKR